MEINKYYNIKDESNIYFNFDIKVTDIKKNGDFTGKTEYGHFYLFKLKNNYTITKISKKQYNN